MLKISIHIDDFSPQRPQKEHYRNSRSYHNGKSRSWKKTRATEKRHDLYSYKYNVSQTTTTSSSSIFYFFSTSIAIILYFRSLKEIGIISVNDISLLNLFYCLIHKFDILDPGDTYSDLFLPKAPIGLHLFYTLYPSDQKSKH
ncbi:hypothetical protein PPL_04184 [Heterostelium album PN500]|uniref:Uncharacterized protein n=1 Tax=Heterostelium pallidum (strain ATCC 26659 / Pp 5 / PN500) TaxID=670386 RepID=D3B693_HETP5|nr:hypothetical protein PPL_04184 [Heterostelium album PN500]EFA83391.1 hypothetical protein PPL_04184 [Heterostelium album PN500]|eukprot:XP_020435508.1 hypothetical protein PPL_04184 [Heterostelium album PN500]